MSTSGGTCWGKRERIGRQANLFVFIASETLKQVLMSPQGLEYPGVACIRARQAEVTIEGMIPTGQAVVAPANIVHTPST